MAFRWIEVLAPCDEAERIVSIAEGYEVSEIVCETSDDDARCAVRLLTGEIDRQGLMDEIKDALDGATGWRIVLTDVEAVTPHTEIERELEDGAREAQRNAAVAASREEVFQRVSGGASVDVDFLALVAVSTVVGAIGLTQNSVPTLVGAIIIAPLLGPHLALAFGAAVGDAKLVLRAVRTVIVGLGLAFAVAFCVPFVVDVSLDQGLIADYHAVSAASLALAVAAGVVAALSIAASVSGALVGVALSATLLPPVATLGVAIATGRFEIASSAAMLLGVNVILVTLVATLILLAKGIRPRHWYQREGVVQSRFVTNAVLALILAGLVALVLTQTPALGWFERAMGWL